MDAASRPPAAAELASSPPPAINKCSSPPFSLGRSNIDQLPTFEPLQRANGNLIVSPQPTCTPSTTISSSGEMVVLDERLVHLNIGGIRFVTTASTLCQSGPNYFTALLSGKFKTQSDKEGAYFINRPGKYFEPILEYLMTGEMPPLGDLPPEKVAREAKFYSIEIPLSENNASLSFLTDDWLNKKMIMKRYEAISEVADPLLTIVLNQFRDQAEKGRPVESLWFASDKPHFHPNLRQYFIWWESSLQHEDVKFCKEATENHLALLQNNSVRNSAYFQLLNNSANRSALVDYCKLHSLTLKIIEDDLGMALKTYKCVKPQPKQILIGFKFVHITGFL